MNVVSTTVRTTINTKASGTIMYMAPEILFQKNNGTKYSDIWSLGCTAIKLFRGEQVWNVTDENELRQKLINKDLPTLSEIPQDFQSIISKCLSYDPLLRPKACDILKMIEKSF